MTNEEVFIKEKMGSRNPFTVPEGYFDLLATQIIGKLPDEQPGLSDDVASEDPGMAKPTPARVAVIRHLRPLLYAAACAVFAVFGVTIYLNKHLSDDQLHLAQQQENAFYSDTYIDEAADYAMLDNDDIYAGLLADL
mgnify:CR=1 FL=1